MITRTFKQTGVAFGDSPANITAKINNVVVYEGPVETLNQPFPELPNLEYTVNNVLFSWTADVEFTGPQTIEVSTDSPLLLAYINANYTPIANSTGNINSSGDNSFIQFQPPQFGNTYINGTLQTVSHGQLDGMWWWKLQANDTFVENVTIEPGLKPGPRP